MAFPAAIPVSCIMTMVFGGKVVVYFSCVSAAKEGEHWVVCMSV